MERTIPQKSTYFRCGAHDVLAKYNSIAQKFNATNTTLEIEVFSTIRSTLGRDTCYDDTDIALQTQRLLLLRIVVAEHT